VKKDLKQLKKHYTRMGWRIEKTNGGHLRWRGPQGELVHSSSTPSDFRSINNLQAQLKRASARSIAT
jgi:hypothetical protein